MGSAFPPHYYDQERLIEAFRALWGKRHHNLDRIERLHRNVLVGGRHLALPLDEYARLDTWGKANDAWIRVAQEVGAEAVRDALQRAGLTTDERQRLKELERENRELRTANEILRKASAYFAQAELDRRSK